MVTVKVLPPAMIRSLRPWSLPMLTIARWLLPFGSDHGAMLVDARGLDAKGQPVEAHWRLDATGDRGSYVPVLAALAMVRRRRDLGREMPGARACSGILELGDFAADFVTLELAVTTGR